jgi:hypothetical protein
MNAISSIEACYAGGDCQARAVWGGKWRPSVGAKSPFFEPVPGRCSRGSDLNVLPACQRLIGTTLFLNLESNPFVILVKVTNTCLF